MADRTSRNWRIELGYDGTDFVGSQRQPGVRTVQGELEATITRLVNAPVTVALSGRTDRGVHAVGQVASARFGWAGSEPALLRGVRALAPDDIAVYHVSPADDAFHARFSARWREYRYRIWCGDSPPALSRRYVWHVRTPIALARMAEAAKPLIGTHDFAALAGGGQGVPWSDVNTVRTVRLAEWREVNTALERRRNDVALYEFRVIANGFLPQMVRTMVGSLVEIGRGIESATWLSELLESRDRRMGKAPAPPQGLVLWRVTYDKASSGVVDSGAPEQECGVEGDEDVLTESV